MFRGSEACPRTQAIGGRKSCDVPDLGHDGRRGDEPDARDRGEPLDAIVAPEERSELALGLRDFLGQGVDEAEVGIQARLGDRRQGEILEQRPTRLAEDVGDISVNTVLGQDVLGSKTLPRLRVARHGSFLELVVFKWRLTAVHHDGVELE